MHKSSLERHITLLNLQQMKVEKELEIGLNPIKQELIGSCTSKGANSESSKSDFQGRLAQDRR